MHDHLEVRYAHVSITEDSREYLFYTRVEELNSLANSYTPIGLGSWIEFTLVLSNDLVMTVQYKKFKFSTSSLFNSY